MPKRIKAQVIAPPRLPLVFHNNNSNLVFRWFEVAIGATSIKRQTSRIGSTATASHINGDITLAKTAAMIRANSW